MGSAPGADLQLVICPMENKLPSICSTRADEGVRPYGARLSANSHIFGGELNSKVGIFGVDVFRVKITRVNGVV